MPKNIRLNFAQYFIMKSPNKRELQETALNHPSDIDFQEFMNRYKECTQNHTLYYLLMLLLRQIILYVSERIFQKEYKIQRYKDQRLKNCNAMLTKMLTAKILEHCLEKLINMNILQAKKYNPLIKRE